MKECSKSIVRRMNDSNFVRRFFVGEGVDIGGRPDPLALYLEFFPSMTSVRTWDLEDGDAQYMADAEPESFDFVHSSHCLEHLNDPRMGLKSWLRITRPGGFLVVTVPDEDMYEQGVFPSTFNRDHKWTFTVNKRVSWSPKSVNILDLITSLNGEVELERLAILNSTYRQELPRYDQTLTPITECGIEFVLRKRPEAELRGGSSRLVESRQPPASLLVHFNQYRQDLQTLKLANDGAQPFCDENEI